MDQATSRSNPTMADVAARAGVSHQTVSRVLNDHPSVRASTRARVEAAIAQLGYRRNLAARTLVTGRSHIIGVLVSSTRLSGPSGAMLAIERTARAAGYWVALAGMQERTSDEVDQAISHFRAQGVDGIIAVAQTDAIVAQTLAASQGTPTVLVSSGTVPDWVPRADIDQAGGALQAMTLLRGLGHRRIAHVRGPVGDHHADRRAAAWRTALAGYGVDPDPLEVAGTWSAASGYRAGMALLAAPGPLPTAVFAANDALAMGVLRAFNERGLVVPRDVSVVGFDDIEGVDCAIPPLTTMRQDQEALGAAALGLLAEAVDGLPARWVDVPAQLVVRASTGPVPADPAGGVERG